MNRYCLINFKQFIKCRFFVIMKNSDFHRDENFTRSALYRNNRMSIIFHPRLLCTSKAKRGLFQTFVKNRRLIFSLIKICNYISNRESKSGVEIYVVVGYVCSVCGVIFNTMIIMMMIFKYFLIYIFFLLCWF